MGNDTIWEESKALVTRKFPVPEYENFKSETEFKAANASNSNIIDAAKAAVGIAKEPILFMCSMMDTLVLLTKNHVIHVINVQKDGSIAIYPRASIQSIAVAPIPWIKSSIQKAYGLTITLDNGTSLETEIDNTASDSAFYESLRLFIP